MKYDNIHIGTSGFHYEHWKGPFYPEGVDQKDFLKFYSRFFHTVELNNTFYQLPRQSAVVHWRQCVPEGFIFAVKASRYITHVKRLHDPADALRMFYERIELFEDMIGPILFQFPPRWNLNYERMAEFIPLLSHDYRYTFEFRDPSWYVQEIYDLLAQNNIALCIYDAGGTITPQIHTTDFAYIRMHGPKGVYEGKYPLDNLAHWADTVKRWSKRLKGVYCYFNNDVKGYAVENATALQDMIKHKAHAV